MVVMSPEETLRMKLEALLNEHKRLNDVVDEMSAGGPFASIELQRMKKRKLALKDEISKLRDRLTPDIIA